MLFKVGMCFYFLVVTTIQSAAPTILYSKDSSFGLIEVVTTSTPGLLSVCEDKHYDIYQSMFMQGDPTYLGLWYQPLATTCLCLVKNFEKVLLLGLGAGDFLSYMLKYFPKIQVDAVEINPVMIDIVRKFRDTKGIVRLIKGDAFKYIADVKQSYDCIYCDIYFVKPFIAKEYKDFFERINSHLNSGGVFVFNAHIPFIPRVVVEDMFKNFENVVAAVANDGLNVVFICYQGRTKSKEDLEKIAKDMQSKYNFRYSLTDQLQKFKLITPADHETWAAKFPVLE
jgi:spermidine synthase